MSRNPTTTAARCASARMGCSMFPWATAGRPTTRATATLSPGGNGQDTSNIYGTVIRIDVDGSNSANGKYGVPSDNPFVGVAGRGRDLRLRLAQSLQLPLRPRHRAALPRRCRARTRVEEIDIITKGGNYGWNVKEGTFYFDPNGPAAGFVTAYPVRPVPPDLVDPIAQYDHDDGTAVIGGTVYRGSQIADSGGSLCVWRLGRLWRRPPAGSITWMPAQQRQRTAHRPGRSGAGLTSRLRRRRRRRTLPVRLETAGADRRGRRDDEARAASRRRHWRSTPAPSSTAPTSRPPGPAASGPSRSSGRSSLDEPVWMNEIFTSGNSATVRARGSSGFFRAGRYGPAGGPSADGGPERSHGAARQQHHRVGLRDPEPVRQHAALQHQLPGTDRHGLSRPHSRPHQHRSDRPEC